MRFQGIEDLRKRYRHVYVSPHLDDVALSCSGRISLQRSNGDLVLVTTVFAGAPGDGGAAAQAIAPEFTDMEARKVEDAQAMHILDVEYLWLDFKESIFRRTQHTWLGPRFLSPVVGVEEELCLELVQTLADLVQHTGCEYLYLPLGVGHHPDHRVLFEAGRRLVAKGMSGCTLTYYEDIPHAFYSHLRNFRLASLGVMESETASDRPHSFLGVAGAYREISSMPFIRTQQRNILQRVSLVLMFFAMNIVRLLSRGRRSVTLSLECVDIDTMKKKKLAAVAAYDSQIRVLCGDIASFEKSLASYSRSKGTVAGHCTERYWLLHT